MYWGRVVELVYNLAIGWAIVLLIYLIGQTNFGREVRFVTLGLLGILLSLVIVLIMLCCMLAHMAYNYFTIGRCWK